MTDDDLQDARLHIVLPQALKAKIEAAAATEGAERGRPMTLSEWIRDAIRGKLRED